jgi:hypothetical protein
MGLSGMEGNVLEADTNGGLEDGYLCDVSASHSMVACS